MVQSVMFRRQVNREGILKFLRKEVFPFKPLAIKKGISDSDIISAFDKMFQKMSCDEQAIIFLHYGFAGKGLTLKQLAELFGVSVEVVRQRETKAVVRASRTKLEEVFSPLVDLS